MRLGARLGKCPDHVLEFASRQLNAEAFATCIVPEPPGGSRQVSLYEAEHLLTRCERRLAVAA